MKKRIIKIGAFLSIVTLSTIGVKMANTDQISSMGLVFSNMEALASSSEGENGGPCCVNGYKKYHTTTNIPSQRKEYFKDCWCNSKEGYDPVACEC